MNKVLVTGATGFIGRHSIEHLVRRGFEVHSVSSKPAALAGATHHVCDLLDHGATDQLIGSLRPSHLLHFAWYAVHGLYWTSEENLRWLEASLSLARSFQRNGGRRIVAAGSCAEYDWSEHHFSENGTRLAPSTLYGVCKHSLQSILSVWGPQAGLSVAWGRLFFLYGPAEQPQRLVPSVITAVLKGREAKCTEGTQVRDFQHVADAAGAMTALLDSDVQGPVNIGSGLGLATRDVVLAIADRLEARPLIKLGAIPMRVDDPPLLVADVNRLRKEVGWKDQYDLMAGLEETIAWWRQ